MSLVCALLQLPVPIRLLSLTEGAAAPANENVERLNCSLYMYGSLKSGKGRLLSFPLYPFCADA